jgi:hypothetical protein
MSPQSGNDATIEQPDTDFLTVALKIANYRSPLDREFLSQARNE